MIYLIYCKNFYKCHNEPPLSTTIQIGEKLLLQELKEFILLFIKISRITSGNGKMYINEKYDETLEKFSKIL
jgi:hypothetical protein